MGRVVKQMRLEVLLVGLVEVLWCRVQFWFLVGLQRRSHGGGNCFCGWLVVEGPESALIWLPVWLVGVWWFVEFMWGQHGGGVRLV